MDETIMIKSEKDQTLSRILKATMIGSFAVFLISILQILELFELYPWYWDPWPAVISAAIGLISVVIYGITMTCDLVVTDKRVYGKAGFGKRVDLPIDSISAVATSIFNGITVATSSGRISFFAIRNRDEIHNELSALLVGRQRKPAAVSVTRQESPVSNADELKKFKELLDCGAITQEEFDAKKKQLLGL